MKEKILFLKDVCGFFRPVCLYGDRLETTLSESPEEFFRFADRVADENMISIFGWSVWEGEVVIVQDYRINAELSKIRVFGYWRAPSRVELESFFNCGDAWSFDRKGKACEKNIDSCLTVEMER